MLWEKFKISNINFCHPISTFKYKQDHTRCEIQMKVFTKRTRPLTNICQMIGCARLVLYNNGSCCSSARLTPANTVNNSHFIDHALYFK